MRDSADIVIVGGGVIGCAVAYYVARTGARVILVERGSVGAGASSANAGAIAMATKRGGLLLRLAVISQRLHAGLARELDADTEYGVEGNLIVAETPAELSYLEALQTDQRAAGIAVERVSPARCRELNPLLEADLLGGIYCPTDAQANPFKVTQAFARAAQNHGAVVFAQTAVERIEVEHERVRAVHTSKGPIAAPWVVNAAGPHASAVGAMIGMDHGVVPRRGQLVVLEATADLPAVRVSGASQLMAKHANAGETAGVNVSLSYTRKTASGTVLLGSTNEFAGFDTRNSMEAISGICRCASRFMPRLARLNVLRGWAGLRPYSAAGPLLGRVGGPEGYLVATGHGGDGMALAPVTGLYLAELLARDRNELPLPDFLERMAAATAPVEVQP